MVLRSRRERPSSCTASQMVFVFWDEYLFCVCVCVCVRGRGGGWITAYCNHDNKTGSHWDCTQQLTVYILHHVWRIMSVPQLRRWLHHRTAIAVQREDTCVHTAAASCHSASSIAPPTSFVAGCVCVWGRRRGEEEREEILSIHTSIKSYFIPRAPLVWSPGPQHSTHLAGVWEWD